MNMMFERKNKCVKLFFSVNKCVSQMQDGCLLDPKNVSNFFDKFHSIFHSRNFRKTSEAKRIELIRVL